MKKAPICFIVNLFAVIVATAQTNEPDVRVTPSGVNNQLEVTIAANRQIPGSLVLGSNSGIVNPTPGYYQGQIGRFTSKDYGKTWQGSDEWYAGIDEGSGGDPSVAFDARGYAYVTGIKNKMKGYFITQSNDLGQTWTVPTMPYFGENFDKQMITIDDYPESPYKNKFYCAWYNWQSEKTWLHTSTDMLTFSPIQTLAAYRPDGIVVKTGPEGNAYVVYGYGNTFKFHKSVAGGSFSMPAKDIFTFNSPAFRPNGCDLGGGYSNGEHNFPSIAVDRSCGPYRSRIYIVFREAVAGKNVVKLIRSSNQGVNWSTSSITVSDPLISAYMSWITVDDATGDISIVYHSFDDPIDKCKLGVYVAYSTDGGQSFSSLKVSDQSFYLGPEPGFHHYIGIDAHGGKSYPTWSDKRFGNYQAFVSPVSFPSPQYYRSSTTLDVIGPLSINAFPRSVTYEAKYINIPSNNTAFSSSSGSKVNIKAVNSITLNPGVKLGIGAVVNVSIGAISACNTNASREESEDVSLATFEEEAKEKVKFYPNPFTDKISFEYFLKQASKVELKIVDLQGKLIGTIIDSELRNEGWQKAEFSNCEELKNGTYLYSLIVNGETKSGLILKSEREIEGDEGNYVKGKENVSSKSPAKK
ncbi:MAG TPA: T9SS type A sorting domain-containing protein [Cytophagaceae bacterium]|jgi:hypothetical protein